MRTKILYLKTIDGLNKWEISVLTNRFSKRFDDISNFGFLDTYLDEKSLVSNLIYKTVSLQQIYQPDANSFTYQELPIYNIVPFQINLDNGLLKSEYGGKKLYKLISMIGNTLDFNITIDDLFVNLSKFTKLLDKSEILYSITSLTTENYVPENGLSGRFVAQVLEQEAAKKLINTYETDVTQLSFEIIINRIPISCNISSLGRLAVRAEENEINSGLELLEKTVLECYYA